MRARDWKVELQKEVREEERWGVKQAGIQD